jgi:hypothetical protein
MPVLDPQLPFALPPKTDRTVLTTVIHPQDSLDRCHPKAEGQGRRLDGLKTCHIRFLRYTFFDWAIKH